MSGRFDKNMLAQKIQKLLNDPQVQMCLDDETISNGRLIISGGCDEHLAEIYLNHVYTLISNSPILGKEFAENMFLRGTIDYPSDFLSCGVVPNGEMVGFSVSQLSGATAYCGMSKSGKTTNLMTMIAQPWFLERNTVVAFAKKPEMRHLITIPHLKNLVKALKISECRFSYFQGPSIKVLANIWVNEVIKLIGSSYGRFSAHKLMGEVYDDAIKKFPPNKYPTLRQINDLIKEYKPSRWGMRVGQYQESITFVLSDLLRSVGCIFDYASSDFLEVLFSQPGLYIFEAESLPSEHFSFIATYIMRWLYFRELYGRDVI